MWFFSLLLPCKTCTRRKVCWQREGTKKNKMKTIGKGSESLVFVEHGRNKDFKLFVKLRRKRKTLYRRYCFINDYYMFARRTLRECHQWACHCLCVCVRELAPKQVAEKSVMLQVKMSQTQFVQRILFYLCSVICWFIYNHLSSEQHGVRQWLNARLNQRIQRYNVVSWSFFLLCLITRQNTNDHWP